MIQFHEYIKSCRTNIGLTQISVVEELIKYDKLLSGLDVTTYSRWERGITTPKYKRKKLLLTYFFSKSGLIYPFIDFNHSYVTQQYIKNMVLPKSLNTHPLIMHLPMHNFPRRQIRTMSFQDTVHNDLVTNLNYIAIKALYNLQLNKKLHRQLISNPNNFSRICMFKEHYLGHLFCLKLKTEVYLKLTQFELSLSEIGIEHLVSNSEAGSVLFFGLFSISRSVLKNLWGNLYTWLGSNQNTIEQIGAITSDKDSFHTLTELGMKHIGTSKRKTKQYHSLNASLDEVMLSKPVMDTFFSL